VLDGEVAIHDQQLRSRFDCLREPDPKAVATPPLFMAFDLLYHKRRDLTARPLRDSRARQEAKSGPRPPGHQARARGRQHAGRLSDRVQLEGGPLGPGMPLETPGMAAIAIIVLGLALAGCGGMTAAAILQPRPAPAVTCVQSAVAWSCQ